MTKVNNLLARTPEYRSHNVNIYFKINNLTLFYRAGTGIAIEGMSDSFRSTQSLGVMPCLKSSPSKPKP